MVALKAWTMPECLLRQQWEKGVYLNNVNSPWMFRFMNPFPFSRESLLRRVSSFVDEIPTAHLLSDAIYDTHVIPGEEIYGRVRYSLPAGLLWPATFLGVILSEEFGTRYRLKFPTMVSPFVNTTVFVLTI